MKIVKNILAGLFIFSSLFLFVGCEDDDKTNETEKKVIGTWQLISELEQYQEEENSEVTLIERENISKGLIVRFMKDNEMTMSIHNGSNYVDYPGKWYVDGVTLNFRLDGQITTTVYTLVFYSSIDMEWRIDQKEGYFDYHSVLTFKKL
ncbi:hypothetical protein LJB98_02655 [Bacteroidales bacterium OttesenSCG-928-M11]|nr:hypothetical protein [Bacteroidales bacterium OttesenSCG-928-M11]